MTVVFLGFDLAKSEFALHWVDRAGGAEVGLAVGHCYWAQDGASSFALHGRHANG